MENPDGDKKFVMIHNVDFIADDEDDDLDNGDTIIQQNSSSPDSPFDSAIGCIEDIIVDDEFQDLQEAFMEKHYKSFEESDENKLIYTDIHQQYVDTLEKFIETELLKRLPNFSMLEFSEQLIERKAELKGEVFEMLFTFTEFEAFKELMIDYKKVKEGTAPDISLDFTVTPITPRGGPDVEMMSPSASLNCSSMDCDMTSPRDAAGKS